MATVAFPNHSEVVKLPSGVTYGYTYIPAESDHALILFLHGFPSSSYDWRHQIAHFSSLGFGVIAPDLLGYGETDKPTEVSDYRGMKMAAEINELLDHIKVNKVHGVAHDWGCFLLSRLANYYPQRLLSASFLAAPYRVPGQPLDIDAINALTKKNLGYELCGYWKFFEKPDSAQILKDHIDSFLSLLYPADSSMWFEHMAPLGALESFLKSDKLAERGAYVSDLEMATHRKIMKDEYGPALNWYRCAMLNLNLKDEQEANLDPKLEIPVLMIFVKNDHISNEVAINAMKANVADLELVELETGHWLQLEKKDEVNAALEDIFTGH